jgi:hypothetical protein
MTRARATRPALVLGLLLAGAVATLRPAPTRAQQRPIQDNSFLVEEAYNQEAGVVQHLVTLELPREGDGWEAAFTQEWPVRSARHQLSFTLPAARVDGRSGLGDLMLHYRFQLVGDGASRFALAYRISLIAPTGATDRVPNTGGAGVEVAFPASLVLGEHLVSHTNVGASRVRRAHDTAGNEADLERIYAAQSLVWLVRPRFNLMLEALWERADSVGGPGLAPLTESLFLSPGLRFAVDRPSGLQIVPGVAFPMEIGAGEGGRSVFLYLSLEHPFR